MSTDIIQASLKAKRTTNPIRKIVDNLNPDPYHPKALINLALGDPTIFGSHLQCPSTLRDAVVDALMSGGANGYLPSIGSVAARKAIATYSSRLDSAVTEEDVIIASGCSGAVEIAISVLVNEGDNILVPKPGFPLYQVITESLGAEVKHYPLKPDKDWECDIEGMDALIDIKTKAILINNPSNPCGSSYSIDHLCSIVALAQRHKLPIIADEIYGGLVFNGHFNPIQVVRGTVPVLALGGLAKEYVVPGWRVGWVVVHDHTPRLAEIRAGLKSLTQLALGATSLVQAALPRVLTPRPGSADAASLQDFLTAYMEVLRNNARLCIEMSAGCDLIRVVEPRGAMYAMIEIDVDRLDDSIKDDTSFAKLLLDEENLVLLPGQCFGMRNFVRVVTCPPEKILRAALERLIEFSERHRRKGLEQQWDGTLLSTTTTRGVSDSEVLDDTAVESEVDIIVGNVFSEYPQGNEVVSAESTNPDSVSGSAVEDNVKRARLS